jgi:hypothetical protein
MSIPPIRFHLGSVDWQAVGEVYSPMSQSLSQSRPRPLSPTTLSNRANQIAVAFRTNTLETPVYRQLEHYQELRLIETADLIPAQLVRVTQAPVPTLLCTFKSILIFKSCNEIQTPPANSIGCNRFVCFYRDADIESVMSGSPDGSNSTREILDADVIGSLFLRGHQISDPTTLLKTRVKDRRLRRVLSQAVRLVELNRYKLIVGHYIKYETFIATPKPIIALATPLLDSIQLPVDRDFLQDVKFLVDVTAATHRDICKQTRVPKFQSCYRIVRADSTCINSEDLVIIWHTRNGSIAGKSNAILTYKCDGAFIHSSVLANYGSSICTGAPWFYFATSLETCDFLADPYRTMATKQCDITRLTDSELLYTLLSIMKHGYVVAEHVEIDVVLDSGDFTFPRATYNTFRRACALRAAMLYTEPTSNACETEIANTAFSDTFVHKIDKILNNPV